MTEREFKEKVLTLRDRMYGMGVRAGLPPDDAADAVQETLVRLWRRGDALPPDAAQLSAYCLAAMRNACLEWHRGRRPVGSLDEAPDVAVDLPDEVEYVDTRTHVERLIDSLPAAQGKAVRLSSFAGMDSAEIAEAMGQTEGNVRQLLSRGRKKLKELWKRYE